MSIRKRKKDERNRDSDYSTRFKKLRKEHVKAVRKLVEQKQNVENTLEKRKIISEYVDPGSQVYAPMTRLGVFMDRGCEQFVVKSKYLSTYRGTFSTHESIGHFTFLSKINHRIMYHFI